MKKIGFNRWRNRLVKLAGCGSQNLAPLEKKQQI